MYNLRVFSPNQSCAPLREIPLKKRILLRLGSTTPLVSQFKYLELNSIDGIIKSSNKIKMKKVFDEVNVKHSTYISTTNKQDIIDFFNFHKILIVKNYRSSKGEGIYFVDDIDYLNELLNTLDLTKHVFEEFLFFNQEYRVHVDVNHGCFYACKKILNEDAEVDWHKHGNNSTFALVDPDNLPECWNEIINQCQLVMKHLKLDIICFDVLCNNNDFVLVETNTAPALANNGINYYINHLKKYYDR